MDLSLLDLTSHRCHSIGFTSDNFLFQIYSANCCAEILSFFVLHYVRSNYWNRYWVYVTGICCCDLRAAVRWIYSVTNKVSIRLWHLWLGRWMSFRRKIQSLKSIGRSFSMSGSNWFNWFDQSSLLGIPRMSLHSHTSSFLLDVLYLSGSGRLWISPKTHNSQPSSSFLTWVGLLWEWVIQWWVEFRIPELIFMKAAIFGKFLGSHRWISRGNSFRIYFGSPVSRRTIEGSMGCYIAMILTSYRTNRFWFVIHTIQWRCCVYHPRMHHHWQHWWVPFLVAQ